MVKRMAVIVLAVGLLVTAAYTQDIGNPDSLIIATVQVDPGISSVMLPVYAVADNPIIGMTLPLEWDAIENQIHPASVYLFPPLLMWDEMEDSIDMDNNHLLIWGSSGNGPVLYTGNNRELIMRIRIIIHPDAEEQFVPIQSYIDDVFGAPSFTPDEGSSFTPEVVNGGVIYGQGVGVEEPTLLPTELALDQNYPNPFNLNTEIQYTIPSKEFVTLDIYNILGERVRTLVSGLQNPGRHSVIWDGANDQGQIISTGLYFYTLSSGDIKITKKMLLLK